MSQEHSQGALQGLGHLTVTKQTKQTQQTNNLTLLVGL